MSLAVDKNYENEISIETQHALARAEIAIRISLGFVVFQQSSFEECLMQFFYSFSVDIAFVGTKTS